MNSRYIPRLFALSRSHHANDSSFVLRPWCNAIRVRTPPGHPLNKARQYSWCASCSVNHRGVYYGQMIPEAWNLTSMLSFIRERPEGNSVIKSKSRSWLPNLQFFYFIYQIQAELKLPEPSATPNHSAKRHYRVTSYFGEMPSRDFKAPILFRCCNVNYIKEENRLEIPKGEFVGRSVL